MKKPPKKTPIRRPKGDTFPHKMEKGKKGARAAEHKKEIIFPPIGGKYRPVYDQYGEQARVLYVEKGLSAEEVARMLPVGRETVRKWARGDGWDAQREARRQGPKSRTQDIQAALDEVFKAIKGKVPGAKDADVILKLQSALEKASGDAYFPKHFSDTMELWIEFLRVSRRDELVAMSTELLTSFTTWVMSARESR